MRQDKLIALGPLFHLHVTSCKQTPDNFILLSIVFYVWPYSFCLNSRIDLQLFKTWAEVEHIGPLVSKLPKYQGRQNICVEEGRSLTAGVNTKIGGGECRAYSVVHETRYYKTGYTFCGLVDSPMLLYWIFMLLPSPKNCWWVFPQAAA